MNEIKNYRDNILSFIAEIKGKVIKKIQFNLELDPILDFVKIPFEFKYCLGVFIETEEKLYEVFTSMNSDGFETFWIEQTTNASGNLDVLHINSIVNEVYFEIKDEYIYKLHFRFENFDLLLYAGEIYEMWNGSLEYKIQDEMILVFKDIQNANKFEKMVKQS